MPSISLFFSKHNHGKKVRDELAQISDFTIVKDKDIIQKAAEYFPIPSDKFRKALYHKTSVFNKFTLERELNTAYLKLATAEKLKTSGSILAGFTALLIPAMVTHVLRVLVVDDKATRTTRLGQEGGGVKEAEKMIHDADVSAYHWTEFLFGKEPWDKSLYDIIIPADKQPPQEIATFIAEQCAQGSLLETPESIQAIKDMELSAQVEINLLHNGQNVKVETSDGNVQLYVKKSVLNFNALSRELSEQAATVDGVKDVQVAMGKDYSYSIYRDQEFKLPPKVLLVDDEKEFVLTLSERLISRNVGSYAVYGGQEALDFISDDQPDVMVLDLKMPGISGMEVLKQTKKQNPNIEIIILTGHGSEKDKENCMELGAFAYLQKPTDIQTLSETIRQAHEKSAAGNLHA